MRRGPLYMPPGEQESIFFPGFDGGAEWGGSAFYPDSRLLYVNANDVPYTLRMLKLDAQMGQQGRLSYLRHCAGCHGENHEGDGRGIPPLGNLRGRYSLPTAYQLIRTGRGRMPGFPELAFSEAMTLLTYLLEGEAPAVASAAAPQGAASYVHTGYNRFVDAELGAPGIEPPWGTLNAIDLEKGEIRWRIPLGYYPALAERLGRDTGAENYGGPVVTRGGLVFIAGTPDEMFRAFEKESGRLLWEAKLPAAGFATPATYMVGGRQYVVVAAGGGKLGSPPGDTYVAFALPRIGQ
jgi:quinoprotein glucose dehydrogenase